MLTHLDLFSGIGGFALACQWAGIETIGFVEIDKYCQKVLRRHWPGVPIVEDIRDVEKIKEIVANTTNLYGLWSTQHQGQDQQYRRCCDSPRGEQILPAGSNQQSPALLITAGFPCQPFSVAGKRGSKEDDRYLWPETIAVIKAVKPKWVLLENVTGIINLALDTVLSDLEGAGYTYETLIIPACAVGAWHRRDRVWIVGYASGDGLPNTETRQGFGSRDQRGEERANQVCQSKGTGSLWQADVANTADTGNRQRLRGQREGQTIDEGQDRFAQPEPSESSQDVADANREGLEVRSGADDRRGTIWQKGQASAQGGWWAVEPELGRVAHGIPHRVDRLKCLGNAIVPQVAFEIIKVIQEVNG